MEDTIRLLKLTGDKINAVKSNCLACDVLMSDSISPESEGGIYITKNELRMQRQQVEVLIRSAQKLLELYDVELGLVMRDELNATS